MASAKGCGKSVNIECSGNTDSHWLDDEVSKNRFRDERLGKRFRLALDKLWEGMQQSIPLSGLGQYQGSLSIFIQWSIDLPKNRNCTIGLWPNY